nr:hypothetical protein [Klebsiella pneumoniae]MUF62997.1 hypothetical protein [Klebsiella pneumoniae]
MNDFITEAWLRANHTLSEGGEIHLPADARLTPSARELLESRHLRVKFLDRQGRLFVEDDEQTPQPVHVLTSSDLLWSNLNGHFDRVFSPRQG